MQKDIALKQLAEHEDVFAEVFNQLAFGGKNIITPGELTELHTEVIVMEMEGQLREKRRDIVKADRRGQCYHLIFDLENQDRIDYTMPVRIMGYEVASYEKQIREMAAINQYGRKRCRMDFDRLYRSWCVVYGRYQSEHQL